MVIYGDLMGLAVGFNWESHMMGIAVLPSSHHRCPIYQKIFATLRIARPGSKVLAGVAHAAKFEVQAIA
jgi:hypothetical protein